MIDNLVLEENINSEENGISSKSIEDLKLEQSDSYFDCFDEYFDTLEFDTTRVFDDTKPNNFNEYFDALDGFDIKESNEHCHHDHYSVETSLNWFSEFIFKYLSAFIFSFPGYFICYYLTMFWEYFNSKWFQFVPTIFGLNLVFWDSIFIYYEPTEQLSRN